MARGTVLELQEAWRMAIEKEKESRTLYQRLGAMTDDAALKELFDFLRREEERHQQMLQDEYDRAFTPDM